MAASAPAGKSPAAGGEGKEMSDGAGSRMGVAGALSLSVTSSVAIVICNKYLISTLGFFFGERTCFRNFLSIAVFVLAPEVSECFLRVTGTTQRRR
jgi:hypothetical protein